MDIFDMWKDMQKHNVPCGNIACAICITSTNDFNINIKQNWNQTCPTCGKCPTCGNSQIPNPWTIISGGTAI